MSSSSVVKGAYGYYFPYTDEETGKEKGLKILDWVYNKYYEPGYMTDQHIEDMLKGKVVTFNIPTSNTDVTASVIPYTTKAGVPTKIIKFESDEVTDDKIILANAAKIATSYWTGSRFDYKRPQEVINDMKDLKRIWKTFATNETLYGLPTYIYGKIEVYMQYSKKSDKNRIILRCEVDRTDNSCRYISEDDWSECQRKNKAFLDEQEAARQKTAQERKDREQAQLDWVNKLEEFLFNGQEKVSSEELIAGLKEITKDVSVPNLEECIKQEISVRNKSIYKKGVSDYIKDFKTYVSTYNSSDEKVEEHKNNLLRTLCIYLGYKKLAVIRHNLANALKEDGLDALVADIDAEEALDLGRFKEVQKILNSNGAGTPRYIILYAFSEELDPVVLKKNILNFLKIYHDFYDMPEKDRKAIAKFIAKNKLSAYYDRIAAYDDVVETLIDESQDPKFLKSLLTGIAGTAKAECLKDKTYYFERHARLADKYKLNKPIELVDRLRECIKEFNVSSNVAVLTNIELNADETFNFQFYTFSKAEAGEDFDGRRIQYITKIYNRHYPDAKIGFAYDEV